MRQRLGVAALHVGACPALCKVFTMASSHSDLHAAALQPVITLNSGNKLSRSSTTRSCISAAASTPVGPPPTCRWIGRVQTGYQAHAFMAVGVLLGATILPARTTQKVSSFWRCSTVVCGSAATSKHSLMRDRNAMASVASCRRQQPASARS